MAANSFTFKSPGVFIREVDRSEVQPLPTEVGPLVIGQAKRGPGLFPTIVRDYAEFEQIFGKPQFGRKNVDDVWREGSGYATHYGAVAAQKYLEQKGSCPLTFVRLLGDEVDGATGNDRAGWDATDAYGIFLYTSGSGNQITGALAAVIYTTDASTKVKIKDRTANISGSYSLIGASYAETTVEIVNAVGSTTETFVVSFDKNSDKFIRNVLNTNPEKTNSVIYSTPKNYWLGETYEGFILTSDGIGGASNIQYAAVFELQTAGTSHADRREGLVEPTTPWIVSQDLSADTGSFTYDRLQKLFRLVGIQQAGEGTQRDVYAAIENIKYPKNIAENPYGTFDVVVYRTTATPGSSLDRDEPIEVFAGLTLDDESENFIARRIGDSYFVWEETEERYVERGEYGNRSSYFRVELHEDVRLGSFNSLCLPYGFYGGIKYKDVPSFTAAASSSVDTLLSSSVAADAATGFTSAATIIGGAEIYLTSSAYYGGLASGSLTGAIRFPRLGLVDTAVNTRNEANGFGIKTAQNNYSYFDTVRRLSAQLDAGDYTFPLGADTETEALVYFSLDEIQQGTSSTTVASAATRISGGDWVYARYVSGSRAAGTSITSDKWYYGNTTSSAGGTTGSYSVIETVALNGPGIRGFSVPVMGGGDGLDLTEPDPFANRILTTTSNYNYYSIEKAIKAVSDVEVLEFDSVAIPGLTKPSLQDTLIRTVEDRGDAIALLDIENDYKPNTETNVADTEVSPRLNEALRDFKTRALNTSYAAAYYPAVKMTQDGMSVFMPPTVAVMGVFGRTARTSEPWFAPAGFNRGGLRDVGVNNVSVSLRSRERDDFYEINVNPIARFPAVGPVIFGQKTLQVKSSALDRVNVRRLLIYLKRQIGIVSNSVLFEQNIPSTWRDFKNRLEPILASVKAGGGLTDYRIVLDETTTTPELQDRNVLYGKVLIKPARAIEFIALDVEILRSGESL